MHATKHEGRDKSQKHRPYAVRRIQTSTPLDDRHEPNPKLPTTNARLTSAGQAAWCNVLRFSAILSPIAIPAPAPASVLIAVPPATDAASPTLAIPHQDPQPLRKLSFRPQIKRPRLAFAFFHVRFRVRRALPMYACNRSRGRQRPERKQRALARPYHMTRWGPGAVGTATAHAERRSQREGSAAKDDGLEELRNAHVEEVRHRGGELEVGEGRAYRVEPEVSRPQRKGGKRDLPLNACQVVIL